MSSFIRKVNGKMSVVPCPETKHNQQNDFKDKRTLNGQIRDKKSVMTVNIIAVLGTRTAFAIYQASGMRCLYFIEKLLQ